MSGTVDVNTPGEYILTYTATNGYPTTTVTRLVRVQDTIAPAISGFRVTPAILFPPNHRMVNVSALYQASDASGNPRCALSVSSNEPVNGLGDGSTIADWIVVDDHHVQLRAERSGRGEGRLYTVTLTCQDAAQNSGAEFQRVYVPR